MMKPTLFVTYIPLLMYVALWWIKCMHADSSSPREQTIFDFDFDSIYQSGRQKHSIEKTTHIQNYRQSKTIISLKEMERERERERRGSLK
jgi:hypothetical protein